MKLLLILILPATLAGPGSASAALTTAGPKSSPASFPGNFPAFRAEFFDRMVSFHPQLSLTIGLPALNGQLNAPSQQNRDREISYLEAAQNNLQALAPAASPDEKIDRSVMAMVIDSRLHALRGTKDYLQDVSAGLMPYELIFLQISEIASQGPKALADWEAVAARVEELPKYLEAVRANLNEGLRQGRHAYRKAVEKDGIEDGGAAADFFGSECLEKARSQLSPSDFARLAPRLRSAGAAARQAYQEQVLFLQTQILPAADDNYAIGENEYAWKLRHELGIADSPQELSRKGLELADKIHARMEALAAEIAPGQDLATVMAGLRQDHPADDAELLKFYTETADRARDFVITKKLFNVPPDYRVSITETPPGLRSQYGTAAYSPAPPLEPSRQGVFLVTPSQGDQKKLSMQNFHRIPTTVVHEAFPGHDLQFRSFQHSPGISPVRYLTELAGYAYSLNAEGYAHYAEELMRSQGFFSPKEELAQLGAQLWRAWRIVLDVALHTGQMNPEQVAHALTEKAFIPAPNAAVEAYRYTKMPTQALTYLLGRLQIEGIKSEYKAAMGAAYDEAEFHRLFLGFGTVLPAQIRPVLMEMARQSLSVNKPVAWLSSLLAKLRAWIRSRLKAPADREHDAEIAVPHSPEDAPITSRYRLQLNREGASSLETLDTFAEERYGIEPGKNALRRLRKLNPRFEELIADPGLVIRLKRFEEFIRANNFSLMDPWLARERFSEALGHKVLYRALVLTNEEYRAILAKGMGSPRTLTETFLGPGEIWEDLKGLYLMKVAGIDRDSPILSLTEIPDVAKAAASAFLYKFRRPILGIFDPKRDKSKAIYMFTVKVPELDIIFPEAAHLLAPPIIESHMVGQILRVHSPRGKASYVYDPSVESLVLFKIGPEEILSSQRVNGRYSYQFVQK